MSSIKVTPISPPMILGEGPHWNEEDKTLLFVDHPGGTVNRIFTETGEHQVLNIEGSNINNCPSVIIPLEGIDDVFVVAVGRDLAFLPWSKNEANNSITKPTVFRSFDSEHRSNALNDAKCDPSGRLWAGTKGMEFPDGSFDARKGSLYRIDKNGESSKHVSEVNISNGLTWSHDCKTFYYVDSPTFHVDAFDYEDESGTISNRRVVFDLEKNGFKEHYPDGMTIDLNGNLWVACYNGGKVLNIDPLTGKLLRYVEVPSIYSTSCCFGGPDYATLYVTSATRNMTEGQIAQSPESGKTFAVTGLGVRGSAHRKFNIDPAFVEMKLKS